MIAGRSIAGRIGLNSLWLLVGRIGAQGIAALLVIIVARTLGVAGLGQYGLISGIIVLANTLTTFGTDTLILREVARLPRAQTHLPGAALSIQLALSCLVIALIVALSPMPALRLYSLSLIPLAFSTVYSAMLRGAERMDLYVGLSLVGAVLQAGGAWMVLHSGGGLIPLMAWLVAAQGIGGALAGVVTRLALPDLPVTLTYDLPALRQVIRLGWPLAALMVLSILHQRMGTFVLAYLEGDAAVGWLTAAWRIVEAFKILPYAVLGAMFPVLAQNSAAPRRMVFPSAVLVGFALIVPAAVIITSRPLIALLYGTGYEPATPILQILICALLPYVIGAQASLALVAQNHEKRVLVSMFIVLPVTLLFQIALTRNYGLSGMAWAVFCGEVIQMAMLVGMLQFHARE